MIRKLTCFSTCTRMRCRMRYRTGWTVFLVVCTLIGVFLTYRQIGNMRHDQTSYKKSNPKFYNPQDVFLKEFDQDQQQNIKNPGAGFVARSDFNDQNVQDNALSNKLQLVAREPADIMSNKDAVNSGNTSSIDRTLKSELLSILKDLNPSDLGKAPEAIEMALQVKTILLDLEIYSQMTCKDIDYLRVSQSVKITRRKYVDRAYIDKRGSEVIMKSQAIDMDSKIKCMQSKYDVDKCQVMGNYNLLREIVALTVLKHPTIIKVQGYCIRGDSINYNIKKKGVVLITEPGMAVNIGNLASYSWKSKILYAIQLADLLKYMENSPLGSLGLGEVRARDFVLVDQWIKLVDLDDMSFEEKVCQVESDCKITGVSMYKIPCENGRCVGRNAKQNLRTLGVEMIEQLLVNPPPQESDKVFKLKQKILTLEITTAQLMEELTELRPTAEKFDSSKWRAVVKPKAPIQPVVNQQDMDSWRRKEEIMANKVLPNFGKEETQHDYIRMSESNFPGMNDYTCSASRVAWGCVITVRSLAQAKATCDADPVCKAFVVFTSNPDIATLMTMVAKNSGTSKPERNAGATLFIKSSETVRGGAVVGKPALAFINPPSHQTKTTKETPVECLKHTLNLTADARVARERRLMAHLGLKGFSDSDWEAKMLTQKIIKAHNMRTVKIGSNIGGKVLVDLQGMQTEKQFLRGVFLAESGPFQYHIAHMIAFRLDRILGLYHTPPSMLWSLSKGNLELVKGDDAWKNLVDTQKSEFGSLTGLLTASVPRVVKNESVYINKLDGMTANVVTFSRMEKMQLEYVLLWYLTKTLHSKNLHLGYKGHLINFEADQAFQDTSLDLLGYFHHCQFPNVVYKAMYCFKCSAKAGQSLHSICSLGMEVIDQVLDAGYERPDIYVNHLNSEEIATQINVAAGKILQLVDMCIKAFGREKVLY
ncbi:uncharacterized protein LOC110460932 isoform X2 [Mizuhopecten yessoensis]|uniref:uncharacterized protein LOC110460932 isoform X2 n=1 Tax=Mizuhopecten yessoensis TaxID=6573 RepID=UPI000B45AFDF|nr:uncharacterized protein LOC110460932 isoform X2 [Mizuhopecten yessoensis]